MCSKVGNQGAPLETYIFVLQVRMSRDTFCTRQMPVAAKCACLSDISLTRSQNHSGMFFFFFSLCLCLSLSLSLSLSLFLSLSLPTHCAKGQVRSGLHANGGPVLGRRRKMREYVHNCYLHAAKIDKRIYM